MNATELKVTITKRRFDGSTYNEVATGTVAFVKELRRCKVIGRKVIERAERRPS